MIDLIFSFNIRLSGFRVFIFIAMTLNDFRRIACIGYNRVLVFVKGTSCIAVQSLSYIHGL